jgi:branched-chain amino acid transport system substrate-binding protein
MLRRTFNSLLLTSAAMAVTRGTALASSEVIKIGVSAAKTGPLSGGTAAVYWPTVKLWAHDVNERGGIDVAGQKLKLELIEYDDQTSPEVAIKNIQRLATVDNADFLIAPYSTGINLATAPLIAKYGYPQIVATGAANGLEKFVARWPNTFWMLGTSHYLATGIVDTMKAMRDKGEVGNKVAIVYVGDAFGQEMSSSGIPAFKEAGFEVVYETSYPLGTQDMSPIIASAKAAGPDAFIAYSYPPDSFALTEQAQIQGFNTQVFYVSVGGALTGYGQRFGASAEGIMAMGGVNTGDPKYVDFRDRHKKVTGSDSDYWANSVTYASLEVLEQAITKAGTKDRAAVTEVIKTGTFDTVMGSVKFTNNILEKVWTVGQWQGGAFHGINGVNVEGAVAPIKKPAWS